MQEQTKRKRVSRLTARLGEKDPAGSRRRLMWLGRELLLGCAAYLLGLGRLAFDTRPLGLALLCASGGQTTGILGGLASYPIAAFVMGNTKAALFTFVPSFLVSTAVGAAISVLVLSALKRTHVLSALEGAKH